MHGMNTLLEDVLEDFRIERVLECQESDEDVRDIKIASSVKQLICEGLCCNLFNSILRLESRCIAIIFILVGFLCL